MNLRVKKLPRNATLNARSAQDAPNHTLATNASTRSLTPRPALSVNPSLRSGTKPIRQLQWIYPRPSVGEWGIRLPDLRLVHKLPVPRFHPLSHLLTPSAAVDHNPTGRQNTDTAHPTRLRGANPLLSCFRLFRRCCLSYPLGSHPNHASLYHSWELNDSN